MVNKDVESSLSCLPRHKGNAQVTRMADVMQSKARVRAAQIQDSDAV